ncbi:hypothetical protein V6N13_113110 [Hibiscus sabdariffa]
MDGKAVENDPRDMLVKVIDLAPGAGSVVMDNASRSICIKEADMTWKRSCLVGSMTPIFNIETIQEALRSDGFQVEVCPWFGLTVILKFTNVEEKMRCWRARSKLLRTWLDKCELLEGFEGKKRLKIWVLLQDVPLSVWNFNFLIGLTSRWGKVVEVDEGTRNLRRFDVARILVQTNRESSIPDRVAILVDGKVFQIKVSTAVFEEEQLFIDDVFPANNQSFSDGDALDSEFEYDGCSNEVVVPEGRSKPEPEKVAFDDQGCGSRDSFLASHTDSRVNNGVLEPNGPNLFEVNVVLQEVHMGILEEATGQNLGPQDLSGERKSFGLNLRAGFDKFNWWVAQSKRKSKAKKIPRSTSHSKKRSVVLDSSSGREPLAISQEQRFGTESRSPSEEAYKTLEMGTRVGIQFAVPRSRVVEKLVELDDNL